MLAAAAGATEGLGRRRSAETSTRASAVGSRCGDHRANVWCRRSDGGDDARCRPGGCGAAHGAHGNDGAMAQRAPWPGGGGAGRRCEAGAIQQAGGRRIRGRHPGSGWGDYGAGRAGESGQYRRQRRARRRGEADGRQHHQDGCHDEQCGGEPGGGARRGGQTRSPSRPRRPGRCTSSADRDGRAAPSERRRGAAIRHGRRSGAVRHRR